MGLASLSIYLFAFMHYQTDTTSYLNAVKIFLGQPADEDVSHRIVKIVNYLFPALLYQVGLPIKYSFFAQQWLSYGASAFFAFQLFKTLGFKRREAVYGMFAYLSCQSVAIFNFALMTDGMGWMMELWGLWWSSLLLKKVATEDKIPIRFCLGLGIVFGLGLLIKESVLMAGLYLFIAILWKPSSIWKKVQLNFWVGLSFLIILISLSIYTEIRFDKSMLSWWEFAHTTPRTYSQPYKIYLIQLARTLDLHWFWVILGGIVYLSQFSKLDIRLKSMFLAAIIGLILFPLAWPYLTDRIMFMIPVLLLPALIKGLSLFPKTAIYLLLLGGFLNLYMTYQIYYHKEEGWLIGTALVYGGLLLLVFIITKVIQSRAQ